jgi:DNA-directed RNA polymerase specialized sigma subunit
MAETRDPWEDAYEAWHNKPSPEAMGNLLEASEPVIQSALQSYGRGNPALRSKARQLAVKAYQSYDPNRGAKLRTHVMTQLQPLTRQAHKLSTAVRVPERMSHDLYLLGQARTGFRDKRGRDPSDSELADVLGISHKRIRRLQRAGGEVAESSLLDAEESGEATPGQPGLYRADPEKIWMEYVYHDLGPVDQQILRWRTGMHGDAILSNNEIAARLKLTPGAVSQRAAKLAARMAEGQNVEV